MDVLVISIIVDKDVCSSSEVLFGRFPEGKLSKGNVEESLEEG